MPRSSQSLHRPACHESPDRELASRRVRARPRVSRLMLPLALASAAAGALSGTTACSRCDLYYRPVELTVAESPVEADLFAVTAAKGVALAVGDGGAIVRQANDGEWTAQASGATVALRGVDFAGPEVAVAVGDDGMIVRSLDAGASWSAVDAGIAVDLAGVRCDDEGTCVAVGDDTLLVSDDAGETWAPPASAPAEIGALRAVEIDARTLKPFIAVGLAGAILVSADAQTWTALPGASADFHAVALDGSDWVVGGAEGALFIVINDSLLDESQFAEAMITGVARGAEWMVREDGALVSGQPAWREEPSVINDDAGRPLHAVVAVGDEALVVGADGFIARGRVADERECDLRGRE